MKVYAGYDFYSCNYNGVKIKPEDFDAAALHATQIEVEPYWNVNEAESRDLYYEAEN